MCACEKGLNGCLKELAAADAGALYANFGFVFSLLVMGFGSGIFLISSGLALQIVPLLSLPCSPNNKKHQVCFLQYALLEKQILKYVQMSEPWNLEYVHTPPPLPISPTTDATRFYRTFCLRVSKGFTDTDTLSFTAPCAMVLSPSSRMGKLKVQECPSSQDICP